MQTEQQGQKAGGRPVAVTAILAVVWRCFSTNQITLAAGPKTPCWGSLTLYDVPCWQICEKLTEQKRNTTSEARVLSSSTPYYWG